MNKYVIKPPADGDNELYAEIIERFGKNYSKLAKDYPPQPTELPEKRAGYHPEGCIPTVWSRESIEKMRKEFLKGASPYRIE